MSRQPVQEAWTLACLNAELTINLGMVIDRATHDSYLSALNSYLTFCRLHSLDIEPTQWTLALFVTFQSAHINPKSVDTYICNIANQFETHFPDVHAVRKSTLVSRALQGAKWRYGVPTSRKLPLTRDNLLTIYNVYGPNPPHDDLLFTAQILMGTDCLMWLAKLTWPDKLSLRDYRKVSMPHSVEFLPEGLSFWLPGHKADKFFKGNRLIVHKGGSPDTHNRLCEYLASQDLHFPLRPELWLCGDSTLPTCSWFIARLHLFSPNSIVGQSMRAGGATALAEAGVAPNLIQTAGRWMTDTFTCYIHKNPFLFEALLVGRSSLCS